MKTTTAFSAIVARNQAGKGYMVRSLTKKGEVSKAPLTATDWQLNAFASKEAAEARKVKLEEMNATSRFIVIEIE